MESPSQVAKQQVFKNCPDIKVYRGTEELNITSADLDTSGKIVYVNTEEEQKLFADDLEVFKNFLPVPGVGYLKPGTKVEFEKETYVLLFGWHTNISNQQIYSWFLRPITQIDEIYKGNYMSTPERVLSQDRTLYYPMIDKICKITC